MRGINLQLFKVVKSFWKAFSIFASKNTILKPATVKNVHLGSLHSASVLTHNLWIMDFLP